MARYTNVATNFSGGLITDNLVGRTDLPRTANSCRKLENFFPSLQGPAEYRQGFETTTVDSAYASENYVRQTTVTLATAKNYRVVFGNLFLKIYDAESNVLKDTVTTPYTTNQLADLRFSSETDVLYIAHEQHRPRKLTANISFEFFNLRDNADVNLRDSGSNQLRAQLPLAGDDDWTLAEIDTYIEPFLEKDTSDIQLTATKGQEIVRLEKQGAFTAIKSDWDGGTANQFSQDWYVEYDVGGVTVAGQVIASATGIYASEVQPPTNDVVYVDAFDFVTDIKDPSALLQLIDNTVNDDRYEKDGVPDGEIHLRSDTTVLNGSQHGSYIRVHPDRAFEFDVTGTTRTTTRWVKVKRFIGTETHPVKFIYGSNVFTGQDFYQYGNVYKSYGNGDTDVKDGNNVVTAEIFTAGQRTFTWNGGSFHVGNNGPDANSVVGDLSLGVAMLVHEIDTSVAVVESYDSGAGTGNLISAGANVAVTEIANNILITATGTNANTFFLEDAVGRYFKLDYPDGVCYCKVVNGFGNNVEALIRTPVPRNATTGEFQNAGVATSFSEGAWYNNNYPKEVAKFERRRIYGGTPTHPNFVFFSKVDDETDFAPTEGDKEVLDTNGISYALSNVNSSIRWMLAAKELVIGTSRGIFRVIPNQYEFSISPKTIRIELVDEVNCKGEAHMIGTSIFFPDESDTKLMEYKYDGQIQSSNANDLSKFIYPTFIEDQIKRITVQENPQPRIWVLTEGGLVYILSYQRQEEYYAWSKIDHGTVIEDITCVREGYASGNDKVVIATRENTTLQFETLYSPKGSTEEPTEYVDGSFRLLTDNIADRISGGTLTLPVGSYNNFNNGQTVSVVANGTYYGDHSLNKTAQTGEVLVADLKIINDSAPPESATTLVELVGTHAEPGDTYTDSDTLQVWNRAYASGGGNEATSTYSYDAATDTMTMTVTKTASVDNSGFGTYFRIRGLKGGVYYKVTGEARVVSNTTGGNVEPWWDLSDNNDTGEFRGEVSQDNGNPPTDFGAFEDSGFIPIDGTNNTDPNVHYYFDLNGAAAQGSLNSTFTVQYRNLRFVELGSGEVSIPNWSGPTTGAVTTTIGRKYTGTVQPMYPTWDGASKPAFGADEIRVVSTRLHVIKTSKFKLGIGGAFETITLPSANYTGFDKERPVVGSTFGVDRIPEIKQDEPASMTLTAIVTKTDLTG